MITEYYHFSDFLLHRYDLVLQPLVQFLHMLHGAGLSLQFFESLPSLVPTYRALASDDRFQRLLVRSTLQPGSHSRLNAYSLYETKIIPSNRRGKIRILSPRKSNLPRAVLLNLDISVEPAPLARRSEFWRLNFESARIYGAEATVVCTSEWWSQHEDVAYGIHVWKRGEKILYKTKFRIWNFSQGEFKAKNIIYK